MVLTRKHERAPPGHRCVRGGGPDHGSSIGRPIFKAILRCEAEASPGAGSGSQTALDVFRSLASAGPADRFRNLEAFPPVAS